MQSSNPLGDNPPPIVQQPINPYASPAGAAMGSASVVADNQMRKLVKDFRGQMHSLGGLWIFIGVVNVGFGGLFLASNKADDPVRQMAVIIGAGLALCIGLSLLVAGVCTCLKHMWAVIFGLVLSYGLLLLNVISFNLTSILPIVILGAGILQGHRVFGWAGQLRRQGIPLTTKPDQIHTQVNLPVQ